MTVWNYYRHANRTLPYTTSCKIYENIWAYVKSIETVTLRYSAMHNQKYYCHKMYVKFQYTTGEIHTNWSLLLLLRNTAKKPDMLASGITNASIFELFTLEI